MEEVLQTSVIIPAFNAERHIVRAVNSAVLQSRPPLEIIVVDDGSIDSTGQLVARFGAPVRCITQKRSGVSVARNLGIELCRGQLVAFLDADDEWLPGHLEQASDVFERYPGIEWYSAAYERRERSGRIQHSDADLGRLIGGAYFEDYFEAVRLWINYTPTMVLRRRVLHEVGCFAPELATAEDLDLWFRIGLVHPRIGYGREITVIIRETAGSLVTQGLFTLEAMKHFVTRCESKARELGRESDPDVRAYLLKWCLFPMRAALLAGDREMASWIVRHFGAEMELPWRFMSSAFLSIPRPLWSVAVRGWRTLRFLRHSWARPDDGP